MTYWSADLSKTFALLDEIKFKNVFIFDAKLEHVSPLLQLTFKTKLYRNFIFFNIIVDVGSNKMNFKILIIPPTKLDKVYKVKLCYENYLTNNGKSLRHLYPVEQ